MSGVQEAGTGGEATALDRTRHSSLVEKVLEYRFVGAVTAELLRRGVPFDVLRSDVDCNGHDLVIEAGGIVRHIQLKAVVRGGKRANIGVNIRLAIKPSGCVVWMVYDPVTSELASFRWFGGAPGRPLPELGGRRAHHSRGNADGFKAAREGHRIVPAGRFEQVSDTATLVDRMFGRTRCDQRAALLRHLGRATIDPSWPEWLERVRGGRFEEIPEGLDWEQSVELAHLIDGYSLARELSLGDGMEFAEHQLAGAKSEGTWSGGPAELWISMFLEHRRWRFSAPFEPDHEMRALLDQLTQQLRRSLVHGDR